MGLACQRRCCVEAERNVVSNMDERERREQQDWSQWDAWCQAHIRNAIEAERAFMLQVVGQALGEMLQKERQEAKSELVEEIDKLRIELARAQTTIAELRALTAGEQAKVPDGAPLAI
jgi:hypothetical protein